MKTRVIAWGLSALCSAGALLPGAALAREANAKENTTHAAAIGLTAASAVLLTKKNTRTTGIVVGAGAAYAWKKHHDYVVQRHKQSARPARSVRVVYRYRGKEYKKKGPNGRAWGYYNRSAHSGWKKHK